MGGAGFEPAKAMPSDLQSDPFDRSGNPPGFAMHANGIRSTNPVHSLPGFTIPNELHSPDSYTGIG